MVSTDKSPTLGLDVDHHALSCCPLPGVLFLPHPIPWMPPSHAQQYPWHKSFRVFYCPHPKRRAEPVGMGPRLLDLAPTRLHLAGFIDGDAKSMKYDPPWKMIHQSFRVIFPMLCTFINFVTNVCEFCNKTGRYFLQCLSGRLPQGCFPTDFRCCISYSKM